jgi:hypothetical protein
MYLEACHEMCVSGKVVSVLIRIRVGLHLELAAHERPGKHGGRLLPRKFSTSEQLIKKNILQFFPIFFN